VTYYQKARRYCSEHRLTVGWNVYSANREPPCDWCLTRARNEVQKDRCKTKQGEGKHEHD